jgi:predicted DNA-binding WGR domain protein
MTEGHNMNKKWCLLKTSDGVRGAIGKKKVYEVIVDGTKVRTVWGMAEKESRQTAVQNFFDVHYARQYAAMKVQEKLDKGYEVAYTV